MIGKFVVRGSLNFNFKSWAMVMGTVVVSVASLGIPAFLLWLWRRNRGGKVNGNG
jgi:hypothetical protein